MATEAIEFSAELKAVLPKCEPRGEVNIKPLLEKARAAFAEVKLESVSLIAWKDASAHVEFEPNHAARSA